MKEHRTGLLRGPSWFAPRRGAAVALVSLFSVACSCSKKTDEELARKAGLKQLDATEAKTALAGKTIHGIHFDGKLFFYATFLDDTNMKIKLGTSLAEAKAREDSAAVPCTWRITNDGRVCTTPKDNPESCLKMYRSGNKFEWFNEKGELASSGSIEPEIHESP